MNEDIQLLSLLIENPEQGLELAMQRYGRTVNWIITKILGCENQSELEECAADVFVRLWQNAVQFDATRGVSLASWLYGITRHTALDYKRRRQRQGNGIPLEEAELQVELNLEDEIARTTNGALLRQTIEQLPPPDKEIFIYRYFLELSVKEIAASLQLSPKQVENKLYRGKLLLKKQLVEKGMIR